MHSSLLLKLGRMLVTALLIFVASIVMLGLVWVLLQLIPWLFPYLERFYSSAEIGWGLISLAGFALGAAGLIIWRS